MVAQVSAPDPIKQAQAATAIRDLTGKFAKTDPPFISFAITNPVTYIRKWWAGVMAGEGIDLKLKIHPFTAVMIIAAVSGVSFSVGRISVPIPDPILQYIPILAPAATATPSPTPDPWQEAAFVGLVQKQGDKYFLVGSDTRIVRLQAPENVLLSKLIGKRILASGKYNPQTMVLQVQEASDLEIVSGTQPVPTSSSTPTPVPSPFSDPEL